MSTVSKGILSGEHPIIFYPPLAKAFDVLGALLIQQVHYWTQVAPKEKDGQTWTYNTAEKWAEQLEVYQPGTVRKRLKELEVSGVLVVGCFNKRGFDRTRWYRLDYQKLCEILTAKLGGSWQILPHPSGKKCHMQVAQNAAPIPESNTETTTESVAMNADEILKQFKAKTSSPLKTPGKVPNVMDLSLLWKKRLAVEGGYVKDLTAQARGQLKLVIKALGGERAYTVLDFALQNWGAFVIEVRAAKGFQSVPEKPDVGFFLKYHDIAVALMDKPKIEAPTQSIAQKPKKESTTPVPTMGVATQDDIAKAMEELEALTKGGL